jgi:hypothetical protein
MFLETEHFKIVNEYYPHIANNIMMLWGSSEMNIYFSKLINDVRYCTRKGFPKKIFDAILELKSIHQKEFPKFVNVDTKDVDIKFNYDYSH